MKISYLLMEFGNKGGYVVLYNFMDNLVSRGHEVNVVLPNRNIQWRKGLSKDILKTDVSTFKRILNFLKNKIIPFVPLNVLNYLKTKRNEKTVNGLIKNWIESDITISTSFLTAYAGYYLSDKTVPLYHMQHFEELFFQNKKERLMARNTYYFPLIKISNSRWLHDIMINKFKQESYLVNPGIDLSIFKPYRKIGLKYKNKKEWTIVSYFDERRDWKGFEDAVSAIKLARTYLSKNGLKINWKIFGIDPPSKKYETEFEYVGPLFNEDLAKLYSDADIVMLTSWYESFPLPPIEAMACGSLIVTTKYGTEDYVFDKENGLVAFPREIENIATKLIYAISNPNRCLQMVQNGLNTAKEYNWEKRTDILEKILLKTFNEFSHDKFKFVDDLVNGNFKDYIYKEL